MVVLKLQNELIYVRGPSDISQVGQRLGKEFELTVGPALRSYCLGTSATSVI